MEIEIHTHDTELLSDILGETSSENTVELPGDASLTYVATKAQLKVDMARILLFALDIGKDFAINLFANAFYDKIKGKTKRLKINGKEVPVDIEEIKKAVVAEVKTE